MNDMKTKEIFLDFTSLLDVVLIILFFFILFGTLEIEEKQAALEEQTAKANEIIDENNKLRDTLRDELDFVRKTDSRQGANADALLEFSHGQNIKLMLKMSPSGWELCVFRGEEVLDTVPQTSDLSQKLIDIMKASEIMPDSTILCEFVLDGSKPGTAAAYREITQALQEVKKTYKFFFYSETDTSILED